jgi:hypothetical protein
MSEMLPDLPREMHFASEQEAREYTKRVTCARYWAIAERWHLTREQGVALLMGADDPNHSWDTVWRYHDVVMTYRVLHTKLCSECADEWMTTPNDQLNGQTPFERALQNGMEEIVHLVVNLPRRTRNGIPLIENSPDAKPITMEFVNRLRDEEE